MACKLIERLLKHYQMVRSWLEEADLPPPARQGAEAFASLMEEDALDASKTLRQSIERIEEGMLAKARERVLGGADRAAAIIVQKSASVGPRDANSSQRNGSFPRSVYERILVTIFSRKLGHLPDHLPANLLLHLSK